MENEKKKKGSKNVVSEKDMGDHIVQRRRVDREGMKEPKEYDLAIPKTLEAAKKLDTEAEILRRYIASLKTENDDAIEIFGKPVSQERAFKTAFKNASDIQKEAIAKILNITVAEASKKIEEAKKEMKKAGFGK